MQIEYDGTPLKAHAFPKDARVDQAAIVSNKLLAGALTDIQRRQQARDAATLASKRMTLREEDLMRKDAGQPGLSTRRKDRRAAATEVVRRCKRKAKGSSTKVVDSLIGDALAALERAAE